MRRRLGPWARRHRLPLVLLVPVLALFAWLSTEDARESWWLVEDHLPVTAEFGERVVIRDAALRLVRFERLAAVTSPYDDPWVPPPGYVAWEVVVEARSDHPDARYCEVRVVDDAGRTFAAPETPYIPGAYDHALGCGDPAEAVVVEPDDPASTPGLRPDLVRARLVVLLPDGATPTAVTVGTPSRDAADFGPRYARLLVP